jgi:3',5'-cyclic AMP phosphodiesterase CpdA
MTPTHPDLDRRAFLKGAGVLAAGGALASCATLSASSRGGGGLARKPVLTIAHLTDIHLRPEGKGPDGLRACLRHVHARHPLPDVIFQGGDCIMSALGATEERTRAQFDLWQRILAEECRLPIRHAIGNHDCWGWQRSRAGTTGNEPLYGKRWVLDIHGMDRGYYSFDQAGWHFVVIDSVRERGGEAYQPLLEEDQFEWLANDLAAVPTETPILIFSHVPIIGVGALFFYDNIVENYQFRVAGALMHQDMHRLKDLFFQHKNIKLCLSGHVHLLDRTEYNGIVYHCNGSVSGSWWHGTHKETPPGYAIVRLYADGTFDNEYVLYPWDATA